MNNMSGLDLWKYICDVIYKFATVKIVDLDGNCLYYGSVKNIPDESVSKYEIVTFEDLYGTNGTLANDGTGFIVTVCQTEK